MTCATYKTLKSPRMKPDPVMYGSRMKLPMKAGRTELAQEIFNFSSTDGGCVQYYMWLIDAADQDGSVERAMTTFRQLQRSKPNTSIQRPSALQSILAPQNKGMDHAECLEECSRNI